MNGENTAKGEAGALRRFIKGMERFWRFSSMFFSIIILLEKKLVLIFFLLKTRSKLNFQ